MCSFDIFEFLQFSFEEWENCKNEEFENIEKFGEKRNCDSTFS